MLSLGIGTQIVLATEPVDLRRGHDGLISLVRSKWSVDPYSGTLFVFLGRRSDRAKVLFFERGGIPEGATSITLDGAALSMLLDGIDLRLVRRPQLWSPKKTTAPSTHRIDKRRAS